MDWESEILLKIHEESSQSLFHWIFRFAFKVFFVCLLNPPAVQTQDKYCPELEGKKMHQVFVKAQDSSPRKSSSQYIGNTCCA